MWMQDGCRVYMDSYMVLNGLCFMGYFRKKPLLGGSSDTKPGDHGNPNAHSRWLILFYRVWGGHMIRNLIEVEGLVTYDFTLYLRIRDHTAWFWRCVGTTFGHFLLSSHNFMVTALGSCVKWPLLYSKANGMMSLWGLTQTHTRFLIA